jgi:DNA-binding transcriptional ArsR family regulator
MTGITVPGARGGIPPTAPLPLPRPKVVPIGGPAAIAKGQWPALLAAAPRPCRPTYQLLLALGWRSGYVWASLDHLAERLDLSPRAVKYHRARLTAEAFLEPVTGGYRGRAATYRLLTVEGRTAALEAQRRKRAEALAETPAPAAEALPLFDFGALRSTLPPNRRAKVRR